MSRGLDNANPIVRAAQQSVRKDDARKDDIWADDDDDSFSSEPTPGLELDPNASDPIDEQEIFGASVYIIQFAQCAFTVNIADLIRSISDPEHPLSLEQLAVVSAPQISVSPNLVNVEFTPTVPHCGASTLIGRISKNPYTTQPDMLSNRPLHPREVAP